MTSRPAPRRTDKPPEELSLTGMLMPWRNGQPAFILLPGEGDTELLAIPLFTTLAKLEAAALAVNSPYDSVKRIDDGRVFLEDIPRDVLVVVDPWITPRRTTRYTQVLRD